MFMFTENCGYINATLTDLKKSVENEELKANPN